MEIPDIILVGLIILGIMISMVISRPMKKHLLAETKIKAIRFLQMPFFLKDYYKMMDEAEDISKKRKFRNHFIIYMISNAVFFISAIILVLQPEQAL